MHFVSNKALRSVTNRAAKVLLSVSPTASRSILVLAIPEFGAGMSCLLSSVSRRHSQGVDAEKRMPCQTRQTSKRVKVESLSLMTLLASERGKRQGKRRPLKLGLSLGSGAMRVCRITILADAQKTQLVVLRRFMLLVSQPQRVRQADLTSTAHSDISAHNFPMSGDLWKRVS